MKQVHKLRPYVWLCVITVILLAAVIFLFFIRAKASALGSNIGNAKGQAVGIAVGTYRGITEGLEAGASAGTEAGLSAEDTNVRMENMMVSMGRLEVLSADVTIENYHQIGTDTPAYSALYLISGDAVFSVDLSLSEISCNSESGEITIAVPLPDLDLYLDQSSTEKLVESSQFSLTVDDLDGISAYLNSMSQSASSVRESISNYDTLAALAESAALSHIKLLAGIICGNDATVTVTFFEP